MAKRAKNTGAWQNAFEVLACLSIMTNCGILYLSPQVRWDSYLYFFQDFLIDLVVRWKQFYIYFFIFSLDRDLTEIMTTELKLILFVSVEHFLLLVAWLIHKAIPDRPKSVQLALARADYESKLALKREVFSILWNYLIIFAWKTEQVSCSTNTKIFILEAKLC